MQFKDYYKIIGVGEDANQDAIKAAYRKKAAKLHPDVNKAADAQKRFTDLGEAYEVLGDVAKRHSYDDLRRQGWREGQELDRPAHAPHPGGYSYDSADEVGDQFSDFFQSFFGGPRGRHRRSGPLRGEDIHHPITVTLEEVYHGGKRQLRMTQPGGGAARLLDVTIPKGITTGENMRLRGQGMPGEAGGPAGDLYLEVTLAPHAIYRVDNTKDILLDLPLAPWEAVLGAQVEAPTLGGIAQVTIPAGARDGQRLRLKGRGLPGKPPGDQYLVLRIVVPPKVSEREQALWRELAQAAQFDPRAHLTR